MTQKVVDVQKLLSEDANEIQVLQSEWQQKGWCFVDLGSEMDNLAARALNATQSFILEEGTKRDYSFFPYYGYVESETKKGLRLLTGPYIERIKLPHEVFAEFSVAVDKMAKDIVEVTIKHCFYQRPETWSRFVPLVYSPSSDRFTSRKKKLFGYGMLDLVQYHTPDKAIEEEMVVDHVDPGLFSISFKSTEPGLQLYDPTSVSWIEVPVGQSILWTGHMMKIAGVNSPVACRHRVVKRSDSPRSTLWYEVCTFAQVNDNKVRMGEFIPIQEVDKRDLREIQLKDFRLLVPRSGTVADLYRAMEAVDGVPPTKRIWRFFLGQTPLKNKDLLSIIPEDAALTFR